MAKFQYSSYSEELSNILDVIAQMDNINLELEGTDLRNLRYFNTTYKIITEAVYHQSQNKYFDNPVRMEKFDILFSKYYFNALKGYSQNKVIPAAWQHCFDYCSEEGHSPTICMALGINAHVNNDLPQAIFEAAFGQAYKSDYSKVNMILESQIYLIATMLDDQHPYFVNYKKCPFLYNFIYYQIIKSWRSKAWGQYNNLFQGKTSVEEVEKYAGKWAILLNKVIK